LEYFQFWNSNMPSYVVYYFTIQRRSSGPESGRGKI
jgi:hypothetical protein